MLLSKRLAGGEKAPLSVFRQAARFACALLLVLGCSRTAGHEVGPNAPDVHDVQTVSSSDALDHALEAWWAELGVEAAPHASDEEFVRRVSLDLLGRIPTLDETTEFLTNSNDRDELVESLLRTDEWADYWATLHLDWWIPRDSQRLGAFRRQPLEWLAARLREAADYDELLSEVLAATGPLQENGAAGIVAAHLAKGGARELAGFAGERLLGLEGLRCAECHDHPFDSRRTKAQFDALAEVFGRTSVKADGVNLEVLEFPIPSKEQTKLRTPFGDVVAEAGERMRTAFATAAFVRERMTNHAVHRLWEHLIGRPLSFAPKLVERLLVECFRESGYDLRRLIAVIVRSPAYDRTSSGPHESEGERVFARFTPQPLSGRQLFASIGVATSFEPGEPPGVRREVLEDYLRGHHGELMRVFDDADGSPAETSAQQALVLLNSDFLQRSSRALQGSRLRFILEEWDADEDRIRMLFLSTLTRPPTDHEIELIETAFVDGFSEPAYEDLLFALMNGVEFRTKS